jgi:hypothetical protein
MLRALREVGISPSPWVATNTGDGAARVTPLTWRFVRIGGSFTPGLHMIPRANVTGITARLTPTIGAVRNSTRKQAGNAEAPAPPGRKA